MSVTELSAERLLIAALIFLVLLVLWLAIRATRLRTRNLALELNNVRQRDRLEWLQGEFDVLTDAAVLRHQELTALHADKAQVTAQLAAEQQAHSTTSASHEAQISRQQAEFAELSAQVLKQQSTTQNQQLNALLTPLQTQLGEFRSRIDQLQHHNSTERASLKAQVSDLKVASERMGRETQTLAQALKGDQARKGDWGEVVLESLLSQSGLRAGSEFLLQPRCTTETGAERRPDVIVRLPGNRDVVIDAKVALGDYQLSPTADNGRALKRHAARLKDHVRVLAERRYEALEEVRSLELVLMFVPLDSALSAALEATPSLIQDALERRVALVSPSSLMLILRLIQSLWQQHQQDENAHTIAKTAANLHDQFARMLIDLDGLCGQLRGVEKTASDLRVRLGEGPESLLRRVDRLRALGAPAREVLPVQPAKGSK